FSDATQTAVPRCALLTGWIHSPIPFNELIPSWNLRLPGTGQYQVDVRVASKPDHPSSWYSFGPYVLDGVAADGKPAITKDAAGEVHTDYLVLNLACDHVQIRVSFALPDVRIDRFMLAISNTTVDKRLWESRHIKPKKCDPATYTRRLDVPFLSQHVHTTEMQGNICSPTSIAMVMSFHGVRKTPE